MQYSLTLTFDSFEEYDAFNKTLETGPAFTKRPSKKKSSPQDAIETNKPEEKQEHKLVHLDTPVTITNHVEQNKKEAAPAAEPSYSDISDLVFKVLKLEGGREKVMDVFASFGVARGPELKPEQYAGVINALNIILGA